MQPEQLTHRESNFPASTANEQRSLAKSIDEEQYLLLRLYNIRHSNELINVCRIAE